MEPENLKLNLPLDEVIKMKEKSKSKPDPPSEKFKKVFVGNLNFSTNWQKLKDYMKKAGNVLFADVFLDQKGRSKGCGLVEFSEHDEAAKAIKTLNDTKLDGRYIYIREDNLSFVKSSKDYEARDGKKTRDGGRDRDRDRDRSRSRSNSRKKHRDHKDKKRDHKKSYKSSKKVHKSKSKSKSKSRSIKSKSRSKSKSKSKSKSLSRVKSEHNENNENNHEKIDNAIITTNNSDMKIEESVLNDIEKSLKRKSSLSLEGKDKGYQIEVKNLPNKVTWQNLKDAFADFGAILSADVENDSTEKSKSVGCVIFERKKDALNAIENMNHAIFNGRDISVKMSKK